MFQLSVLFMSVSDYTYYIGTYMLRLKSEIGFDRNRLENRQDRRYDGRTSVKRLLLFHDCIFFTYIPTKVIPTENIGSSFIGVLTEGG